MYVSFLQEHTPLIKIWTDRRRIWLRTYTLATKKKVYFLSSTVIKTYAKVRIGRFWFKEHHGRMVQRIALSALVAEVGVRFPVSPI